jgi:hypothetical protein
MDFVEGLTHSKHVNCILVMVDSFTKYAHFLALSHPFTAATVAKLFLDQVYRLHGLPSAIISDRDHIFTSKFWSKLFHLADVKLQMSSSYHPDGALEPDHGDFPSLLRECLSFQVVFLAPTCRVMV